MALIIFGIKSYTSMPLALFPNVDFPIVTIQTVYPGADAKTVESKITDKIEEAVSGINGIDKLNSTSYEGLSYVTVIFDLEMDINEAANDVRDKIGGVILPDNALAPRVQKISTAGQAISVFVVSETGDMPALMQLIDEKIKPKLQRISNVGVVDIDGYQDREIRILVDPYLLNKYNLSAIELQNIIGNENFKSSSGKSINDKQELIIKFQGDAKDIESLGNIAIKPGLRLKDVAKVFDGLSDVASYSSYNGQVGVMLNIMKISGTNVIDIIDETKQLLPDLKALAGDNYQISLIKDQSDKIMHSVDQVKFDLVFGAILAIIIVFIFLRNFTATIVSALAIPTSIIGTFAIIDYMGYDLNKLTLIGLTLAIGIFIDDAIVVVENVERNIEKGFSPLEATRVAMSEVTGPIIAIALVLSAVFIPTAFITGLSGQFYKQFALTITISTIISAFNSLTLSPALAALLLKPHDAKPDFFTRLLNKLFGRWLFEPFNRVLNRGAKGYEKLVKKLIRMSVIAMVAYVVLLGGTINLFVTLPCGFIPPQDKQYLVAIAQLPDASSLDRTQDVLKEMQEIALSVPGVAHTVAFPGLSVNGFANTPNSGIVFTTLESFDKRTDPSQSAMAIAATLNQRFTAIDESFVAVFPPPPIQGLGTTGGFKLQIEDRANKGFDALFNSLQTVIGKAQQDPALMGLYSSFRIQVPQMDIDVDREQALIQGIPLDEVFDALQIYLGSVYVNDFNLFGRTYQVNAQADADYRVDPGQILNLKVRNRAGNMVPLGSVLTVTPTIGPDRVMHYNGYPSAELNGSPAPGYSSDQAQQAIEKVLADTLPTGIEYEKLPSKYTS